MELADEYCISGRERIRQREIEGKMERGRDTRDEREEEDMGRHGDVFGLKKDNGGHQRVEKGRRREDREGGEDRRGEGDSKEII